eukprot:CAMPEP_0171492952 /NCGR_PEP_ID=MMETSP0958-20121227/4699_1 /TAXON_ID=87120 /ORGANISM="Aurantiochytrium limacinum, Strain ATCCMYA-1381" /LENGTH=125 /DNA_ID=CAMNT_0012026535 /DNA_START=225 /DNA_END=600 /DNA_ORIENTATION=+
MARDSVARSSARRSATRVSRRGRPGAAGAKVLEDTGADVFRSDEMRVDEDEDVSVKRRASSASPVIPVSLSSQGLLEGVMERHDLLLFNDVYQPFNCVAAAWPSYGCCPGGYGKADQNTCKHKAT